MQKETKSPKKEEHKDAPESAPFFPAYSCLAVDFGTYHTKALQQGPNGRNEGDFHSGRFCWSAVRANEDGYEYDEAAFTGTKADSAVFAFKPLIHTPNGQEAFANLLKCMIRVFNVPFTRFVFNVPSEKNVLFLCVC